MLSFLRRLPVSLPSFAYLSGGRLAAGGPLRRAARGALTGFAIAPARPELKQQIDAALERIKRNGTYDRVNSLFLPFRIN